MILLWNIRIQEKLMVKDERRSHIASKLIKSMVFPRGGDEIAFNQPWELPRPQILKSFHELNENRRYILTNFSYSPGLGNLMFQYASLRALVEKHDAYLIMSSTCLLRRAFGQLSKVVFMDSKMVDKFLIKNMDRARFYDNCCERIPDAKLFTSHNIEILNGYFQNFRNFHTENKMLTQREFRFLPEIYSMAEQILDEAKYARLKNESHVQVSENYAENDAVINIPSGTDEGYVFIGIHARHGLDITFHSRNLNHGHLSAPSNYYLRAVDYFRGKFPENKLIFMVASDAIKWSKKIFSKVFDERSSFYFIESGYREVDLGVLTLCNHTIVSTGTYSWWAGYLANGEVIYYKDWPKQGSVLDKMIKRDEYFLSNWAGL